MRRRPWIAPLAAVTVAGVLFLALVLSAGETPPPPAPVPSVVRYTEVEFVELTLGLSGQQVVQRVGPPDRYQADSAVGVEWVYGGRVSERGEAILKFKPGIGTVGSVRFVPGE